MIDKITILLFTTWCVFNYGPPPFLVYYYHLFKQVKFENFFVNLNILLNNGRDCEHWLNENVIQNEELKVKLTPKYEDKYLKDIRKLNKEWIFNTDEQNKITQLTEDFFNKKKDDIIVKLEQINKEIVDLEKEIADNEDYVEDYNTDENDDIIQNQVNQSRIENIKKLIIQYEDIKYSLNSEEFLDNLKKDAIISAKKNIIDERIYKLKTTYVIEKTPLGNVLMLYDKERETFKYYADSTIPYRYLEVVSRKYVKFFNCRPIFIDMEEELNLFEERWEKQQKDNQIKKIEEITKNETKINNKKNVFAKFKSYNKDVGSKISMAPPKNGMPNNYINDKKENEKVLLKERSNRYTYEGKISNFNFLQKIERKIFNKRLGISFSDFKKMNKYN